MIIKLPVIVNNKLIYELFKLTINKKNITLDVFRDKNLNYQFYIQNKEFCLTKINIIFPLVLKVINKDKMIYSNMFFINALFSDKNKSEIDFFFNFINQFNNIFKTNYKYVTLEYIKKNREIFYRIDNTKTEFNDYNDFKQYVNNKICKTLNIFYSIIYFYNKSITTKEIIKVFKLCKNLYNIFNNFINYKISFLSSNKFTIEEHINLINKNNYIAKNPELNIKYYINNNNNIYNFNPNQKNNTIFSDGNKNINKNNQIFYKYNINYKKNFNINYFIKYLINNDNLLRFEHGSSILGYDIIYTNKILDFIYNDNNNYINLLYIKLLDISFNNFEYEHIYNNNDYKILNYNINDYEFIKNLYEKYKDTPEIKLEIIKILLNNYKFPITYNNKNLTKEFEALMYFCLLDYKNIIVNNDNKIYINNNISVLIPFKLKDLFSNLIKIYYQYVNNSIENITYNYKFYQKSIFIKIIKNILEQKTILSIFFNNHTINNKLKKIFTNNYIIYSIVPLINWKNLGKKLNYLKFIIDNKDIIIFNNVFNKNIFTDNYDKRIKNIIINPFSMYYYLKQKKDFIKWSIFLKNHMFSIFNTPISINDKDLEYIGIFIYKLNNITNQDIKNNNYKDFVLFCKNHKRLIIYQDKININIRNKLYNITKININLGVLLKHIIYTNENNIELSKNIDIHDIEVELKKTKKKYYKYKGKYLKIKSETETSTNT